MTTDEVATYIEQVLAIAQTGLAFSRDKYDIQRFRDLQRLSSALMARAQHLDIGKVADWIHADADYATPKLDVRAYIQDDEGSILLVREKSDGMWTLPGGWCDVGESAGTAVVREVREETGLDVEAERLLGLIDKRKHDYPMQLPHAYKCFFLCRVVAGTLVEDTLETSGAGYFQLDRLPPLSLHRITARQLHVLAAHVHGGRTEALFD